MLIKSGNLNNPKKGHTYVQLITVILANTTLLTYGLQAGWISPMTKLLQSDASPTGRPLTDNELAMIASTMCIAGMLSAPFYGYMAEKFGRKLCIIGIAVPQTLSWITMIFSNKFLILLVARIFCGIAAGGCFCVVPLYTKEISQDNVRGLFGSLVMLLQNIGILAMYAMGAYMEYFTVLCICLTISIMTILLFIKAPESPAFLIKIGKFDDAASTIAHLRGLDMCDKVVQNEINIMRNEELYFKSLPNISYLSIFKDVAWRRGFYLILAIITVQCYNGSFTIVTYASLILSLSGVTFSPELQSLSLPVVMIIGSFIAMCCVERLGRKPLLTISLAVITVSSVCLATTMLIRRQGGSVPGWLPVFSIVTSVCANAAGLLPLPYIIVSEMFNFQIRGKIMGLIVMYAWFISFFQLMSFTPISNALGVYTTFYGFGVINLLGVIVSFIFLPETKGKSIEQIEHELRKKITHC